MCLGSVWTQEETDAYLATVKNRKLTCWKVVEKKRYERGGCAIYPPVEYANTPYSKVNDNPRGGKIPTLSVGSDKSVERNYYAANYHLYTKKKDTKSWLWDPHRLVLCCKVAKEDVTAIGIQDGKVVIVAKRFEFVQGDEFFGEKKC